MRLDKYLSENGFATSRNRALILIEKNFVRVNGKAEKASYEVKENDKITILEPIKYVSMGGYKLEKALEDFNYFVNDKICVDVGASTGGFTQRLLLSGAKKVYCLDVNTSLLDKTLSDDERVEKITLNARELNENTFCVKPDLAVADCSFISLKHILVPVSSAIKQDGEIICLIKPQFECGENSLNKKGIVKNLKDIKNACCNLLDYCLSCGLYPVNFTFAPIRQDKNAEYFFLISKIKKETINYDYIKGVIEKSKL